MGKVIYAARGVAGEYAKYGVSFFVGCSLGCEYCYNKTGRFRNVLGGSKPTLKKCFRDEAHAIEVFKKELNANLPELQKHGLLMSFLTDPSLDEVESLFSNALLEAVKNNVPVQWLTKRATEAVDHAVRYGFGEYTEAYKKCFAYGVTLTGRDDLEPNASPNADRIESMRKMHEAGYKTWTSIEPVIDTRRSLSMIELTLPYCDLYKVGLLRGSTIGAGELVSFVASVVAKVRNSSNAKIYFKDSLLWKAGLKRDDLHKEVCVSRDYNLCSLLI
jgi:hypothetical protein